MRKAIVFILLAFLLALGATPAYADEPTVPHAFYGAVRIYNGSEFAAWSGTVITAEVGGVECGSITTTEAGEYGGPGGIDDKLIVQGDFTGNPEITFYIDGHLAEEVRVKYSSDGSWEDVLPEWEATFESGAIWGLDLRAYVAQTRPGGGGAPDDEPPPAEIPETEPGVPGTTVVSGVVNEEGVFTEEVTAVSEDAKVSAVIAEGTVGLTADGEPLTEITIVEVTAPSPPPAGANIAALVYDFGPDGATFEPPIQVTFTCTIDLAALPEGTVLVVVQWDEAAGAWVDIEVAPGDYIIDTVANTVTIPISHFSKYSVITRLSPLPLPPGAIIPPAPAAFSVSNLTIQPVEVQPKEAVVITISVANTGDMEGSYTVVLKINGVKETEERVTIVAGSSEIITFSVTREGTGSYSVTVDGLSASFTVVAPPPPEVKPPINWPVVGGVIAAVVIVALLIFFLIRRRAY